jgi:16S rRNA C967 or C1407 C5-methylase (RsmB/RsmF family)
MKISPARKAAFDILLRVETTDAYASELLHSSRLAALSPADHGLVTEIVMGVLRWRSVLDEQIASHVAQPLAKLDPEVVTSLRVGAYQLLFLDRIPAHAAINESVELVKQARKRSAAGIVNAVLRKINPNPSAVKAAILAGAPAVRLEAGPSRSASPGVIEGHANSSTLSSRAQHDLSLAKDHAKSRDLLPGLAERKTQRDSSAGTSSNEARGGNASTRQRNGQANGRSFDSENRFASESVPVAQDDTYARAHPEWLLARWIRSYGSEAAQKICEYDQQAPKTVIRAAAALAEELALEGIELTPGKLLSNAYAVTRGDITRTRAFRERRFVIQDEGSQLIALLVGRGERILDCCAAPGGKTRILAEQNPNATVVATEVHPHRAALLKRLVPLPNVQVVVADVRSMPFARDFDRILVDAPCTGTGTLARNPEIKWRLQLEDITRLQAYQIEILSSAMKHVAPGGRILYSTCSLEPEENESVIDAVLRGSSGFRILDIRDRLVELRQEAVLAWPDVNSLIRGHYLRTIPGVHPCDGFFAALLEREL